MRIAVTRVLAVALFVSLFVCAAFADNEGSVEGKVTNAGGQPVPDAVIELVGHSERWKADSSGEFEASVPAGEQRLMVTSARYGMAIAPVNVEPGRKSTIEVRLSPVYRDEVVVSAGTDARPVSEVAQPIAVVSGERLESIQQPSSARPSPERRAWPRLRSARRWDARSCAASATIACACCRTAPT